ncbi:MAG: KaiC domain-containing protein [Candidatus Hydrothermae bacterium]|nr:KaiC domain-containing protein [Candidatus Hydrothermae bacterium]
MENLIKESIKNLSEVGKKAPRLEGVPSGVEGLDDLFFTSKIQDGRAIRMPLGGIPRYSVVNLTGISDTGKSLMAEQFAVKQAARGKRVAFVTVETPATFLSVGLKERAFAMGFQETEEIEKNIYIIDAASYSALREDIKVLLDTLAYAIKTYRIDFTVIDSITGLYEAKEMLARTFVRQVYNFLKKWYQTALLVSQKRSGHEELSAEAAGGYAVSHIVDCTMVLSKRIIQSQYDERIYKKPIGELIRFFRIDGCRMCGHDTDTHLMEITELGLVKIEKSLKEYLKKQ